MKLMLCDLIRYDVIPLNILKIVKIFVCLFCLVIRLCLKHLAQEYHKAHVRGAHVKGETRYERN